MNSEIAGFLLFRKPNRFTVQSPVSPGIHILPMSCSPFGASRDESMAVGTRGGTLQFHQARVDEYVAFKRGLKAMVNIIFENDMMLTLAEYNNNWRYYHNRQMKRWFGEDLIDVY